MTTLLRLGPIAVGRQMPGMVEYVGHRGYWRHWRAGIWVRRIPPWQRHRWRIAVWAAQRIGCMLGRWDLRRQGAAGACEAMWRLNRHAKLLDDRGIAYGSSSQIYAAKGRLIRELYVNGEAFRVTRAVQRLYCYGCGGSGLWGTYYGDVLCNRCGGSGVYRENHLLLFEFRVRGRVYEWHQPRDLVGWESEIHIEEGEPTLYARQPTPRDAEMGMLAYERALATVWAYVDSSGLRLCAQGERRPQRVRLLRALADDASYAAWRIRRRAVRAGRAVMRLFERRDDDEESF